jgi:hypothetical protein
MQRALFAPPCAADLGLRQWQLRGGDPVAALNSLFELVQQHQSLQGYKSSMQEQLHRAKVDVKTADKAIERLQALSQAKEQEAGGLHIKVGGACSWVCSAERQLPTGLWCWLLCPWPTHTCRAVLFACSCASWTAGTERRAIAGTP